MSSTTNASRPAAYDGREGSRSGSARVRIGDYWRPPEIFTHRQPSVNEVLAYARHGEWTAVAGPLRFLGIGYSWVIALPVTVVLYGLAWIVVRPGRAFAAGLVLLVLLLAGVVG